MFYLWITWLVDYCENQAWVGDGMPDVHEWPEGDDDKHQPWIAAGVSLYDSGKRGHREGVPLTWRRAYFLYTEAGYGLDYLEARDREYGWGSFWDLDRKAQKIAELIRADYAGIEERILAHCRAIGREISNNPRRY